MYEIFNPEILGLEPPSPRIEKNARDPGIGIPNLFTSCRKHEV
jgi:hypothetical protein